MSEPVKPNKMYRFMPFPDFPATRSGSCQGERDERAAKLRTRVQMVLTKGEIFFPSPSSFNDPFDCKVDPIQVTKSKKSLERKMGSLLKERAPGMARRGREAAARRGRIDFDRKRSGKTRAVKNELQSHIDGLGVLAVSGRRDSILMWSHYGGGHQGICLELNIYAHDDWREWTLEVDYTDSYPQLTKECIKHATSDTIG